MGVQEKETLDTYRVILKLIRYIQIGNVTTTTLALICLNENITNDSMCVQAILDGRAVTVMLNILEADFSHIRRTQVAILRCLNKLCGNNIIQSDIINSGGLKLLHELLKDSSYELKVAVAELISNIVSTQSAFKETLFIGGIEQLVNFFNAPHLKQNPKLHSDSDDTLRLKITLAKFAAKSLSTLCKDKNNRKVAWMSGITIVCQCWLRSKHQDVIIPVLGLFEQLLFMKCFRKELKELCLLQDVLSLLGTTNMDLKQAASHLIVVCLGYTETFKYFQQHEFITEVFTMLCNQPYHKNTDLMYSLSGILLKSSRKMICIQQLEALSAVPSLIQLLVNQPVKVKANIVGILGMCVKRPVSREIIKKNNGIEIMVQFLQTTHSHLLINLNKALSKSSEDKEILVQYQHLDAVQLIWSCLRNTDFHVQSSAASCLCTILKNMKHQNLEVLNVLDGIECVITLLSSPHKKLLTPACSLIHTLAQDKDILAMLIEFNVAELVAKLMNTSDKKLLHELCLAVASCCSTQKSSERFASCGIILPLLNTLKTKNNSLRIAAAFALSRISVLSNWCPVAYQNKIKPILIEMITDVKNKDGNESAAIILRNICGTDNERKFKKLHKET